MKSPAALTATVQQLYAAFGRGDIPTLLAGVADNVDWHLNIDLAAPGASAIPDFQRFRGRSGVGDFFTMLGRDHEFHSFQPNAFFAGGNEVAVRVAMELTVKPTKRRIRIESMHVFTFDESGKVSRFVEYLDTLSVAAAWDAVQASA